MNWKILIVDDEPSLTDLLRRQFTDCGYTVFAANNSSDALKLLKERPDIILLDINMPGKDGLAFCREIRESVSCPILFLTARIMEQDKLAGFRDGGDDYITKPFSLAELTARVEAHLRRERRNSVSSSCLTFHGLTADLSARELAFEGEAIALTRKEFDIIALLWANPNQVFDRERIYESVWGLEAGGKKISRLTGKRRVLIETPQLSDVAYDGQNIYYLNERFRLVRFSLAEQESQIISDKIMRQLSRPLNQIQ